MYYTILGLGQWKGSRSKSNEALSLVVSLADSSDIPQSPKPKKTHPLDVPPGCHP